MSKPILKKRSALGKGLSALLSDADTFKNSANDDQGEPRPDAVFVPVENIEANPFQPRTDFEEEALEELSDSIKLHGVIQPITVRKLEEGKYQLIAGERRWRASKLAGLEKVPAYVRVANDQEMLEMAIIENVQRADLNPIEVALSYQRLIHECELRQEDLGNRVGKKRSTVTNYLRLLKLPPDIQAGLRQKNISMGHARAMISIEDIDKQLFVFNKIVKQDLSVRKAEELIRQLTEGNTKPAEEKQALTDNQRAILEVQQRLSSQFGTQVRVQSSDGDKGEIKIPFHTKDDLNRLLELLGY